jgi:pimeloyl-ACP methyl ester carboxylesterase
VRELAARRAIDLQRTMLAGHSMGGAIALRVGARLGVAGVVAVSPAPQRAAHGLPPDMLPYTNEPPLPPLPPHTLAITGAFEPLGIREITEDLINDEGTKSSKYLLIPRATHVSVLFDSRVVHAAQEWTAATLQFSPEFHTPSAAPLFGGVVGLAGILLLAGPFVSETLGMPRGAQESTGAAAPDAQEWGATSPAARIFRPLLEVAAISFLAVGLLRFWNPLAFVRMYNGAYFASFLVIAGIAILLLHGKAVRALWPPPIKICVFAALAALILHLLISGWSDMTMIEAWSSWARWARFPALLAAAFACLFAEELLLGPAGIRSKLERLWLALTFRTVAFVALVFGIFVLHSGAILLILLGLYIAFFSVMQRMGMDLVRRETGSTIAAALFGAILLAGFCLVIFPVT